ncbi:hypothetical protein FB45DRAFT_871154 [Roridomyces roridus]|uniref:Uncharacterized protein n=1 Tax=Roridomyces roridus TaxID=1738132 RepID=A0AAD7BG47_9AGAR|nr:hypothetical protein FB45DRAFT_871154 [Roridomyces roridus]
MAFNGSSLARFNAPSLVRDNEFSFSGDFNLDDIPRMYHKYNSTQPTVIRVAPGWFILRFPGYIGLVSAWQFKVWVLHNRRLHIAIENAVVVFENPAGYVDFANLFNLFGNRFGWAIWTPEGIIYPAEHLDIADYADFLVGNDDIDQGRGVIRPGHVQVEEQFFELLMDSWKHRAMNKERSIKQSQYAKLNYAGLPDVGSVANKAALALKRKATGHLVGESSRAASAMTAAAASTSAAANAGSGSLALHFPAPPAANFAPAMPAFPAPAGANFAMGPPGMPTLNTAVHPMFAHRSNSAPSPSTTVMPSPAVSAMTSPLRGTTPPAFIGLDTTNLTAAELADLDLTNFSTSVPVMLGPFLASSSTTDDTATSVRLRRDSTWRATGSFFIFPTPSAELGSLVPITVLT